MFAIKNLIVDDKLDVDVVIEAGQTRDLAIGNCFESLGQGCAERRAVNEAIYTTVQRSP